MKVLRPRFVALTLVVLLGACSTDHVTPGPAGTASAEPTATPDLVPPTLVTRDPAPGGRAGPLGRLDVAFDERVIGVDLDRFQLRDAWGEVVPATISADESGRRFRLTPNAPLTVAATYTATLTGAIHDAAGNWLAPIGWTIAASTAVAFEAGPYTGYQFDGDARHITALQRTELPTALVASASEYRAHEGQGFLMVDSGPLAGYWIHGTPDGHAQNDLAAPITPLPACDYLDLPAMRADPDDWRTVVLDTVFQLPSSYRPTDLVDTASAGLNRGFLIRSIAVADLGAMVDAAAADGVRLAVLSAYRSYATQIATFQGWVDTFGYDAALLASARPGHSEHQLGTVIDFRAVNGPSPFSVKDWATTTAGAWMLHNAWRFGWVLSYPKDAQPVSCYQYEPWHYRYLGRGYARAIHESGLTEREWLWRQGFGIR